MRASWPSWAKAAGQSLAAAASSSKQQSANVTRQTRFVDATRVRFVGGRGGDGCIAMLSLFANEFAGPAGGNGGNGGHVVLRADEQVKSLNKIAATYRGLPVPIGTLVLRSKPKHLEEHEHELELEQDASSVLAELDEHGSMFIAARGGAGGRGNASFLSNKNRHPNIAERGADGEMNHYELRMKFYAHVALLGLPNVGKSTLLGTLTGAAVKIGNYAFTTLHPQVGTLEYEDFTQVTVSDLPGLVEESHKNRGLGLSFLRSLRRCHCLLYVIDLSSPNIIGQYETLVHEIDSHHSKMSQRPSLVFGNKSDLLDDAAGQAEELRQYLAIKSPQTELVIGSAQKGAGLSELRDHIRRLHEMAIKSDDNT